MARWRGVMAEDETRAGYTVLSAILGRIQFALTSVLTVTNDLVDQTCRLFRANRLMTYR